jgi:hypothetical protein
MDIYRTISRFVQNHPTAWNVLHPPYILAQDKLKKWRTHHQYKGRLIRSAAEGNERVKRAILLGRPCLIGKIGSTESQGLDCYLRCAGSPTRYPPILRDQLYTLCGVFPPTDAFLDQFCSVYLSAVDTVDLLAVWGNSGESNVVARHASKAVLIQRLSLEPYHFDDPWSSALAGKTVLVVHPFVATIERQMRQREKIWGERRVLPDFSLVTLRMPQSPALQRVKHAFVNWLQLRDQLFEQIERLHFDVALIGAGAMSLPLAAFVKSRGAIGIHTGGPTQILFGILGRRWEETREHRVLQSQFNEYWTRPADNERPPEFKRIEQGGYW